MGNFYKFIEHERHNRWGNDYIFMEENGKAVGRVYVYHDDKDKAYIEGLHVSENERLKTIGSELLNKLIEKCKELGAKECMLWCYKDEWVFDWYQRLGFQFRCIEAIEGDNDNIQWMSKRL